MTEPSNDKTGLENGAGPAGVPAGAPDPVSEAPVESGVADSYGLSSEIIDQVSEGLAGGDTARVRALFSALHYADAADLLECLSGDERALLVENVRDIVDPDTLSELDETVRDEVIEILGPEGVAELVPEMDTDDAVYVVEEMDEADRQEVLDALPAEDRALIEESLSYPDDSAGRLMQRELVKVPVEWTVGQTIDFIRHAADDASDEDELPHSFYDIFVVDADQRPVGAVPLSKLLRTRRPVPVETVMETELRVVPAAMDQEEVAFLFRQRDLTSAPVVDDAGRLVGAITIDDVVDVIDEEHEEDFMRLGGVREGDLYSAVIDTVKARFTWLVINLGTAVLASTVIGLFGATIERMVALAVLMPIVASMGGNAGTQTLTVAVRALATRELTPANAMRVVGKELMVGSFNGVLFAALTGLVAWGWFHDPALGAVIGIAMIVNLVVAGLAGTTIPLMLERAGVDPAVASSVFLTTVTDLVGFFVFLGLAAWILL